MVQYSSVYVIYHLTMPYFVFVMFFARNEALRVAFIHVEEIAGDDGKVSKEFYSKLVKADAHGKDQVWYIVN